MHLAQRKVSGVSRLNRFAVSSASPAQRPLRIAIFGFGTVGSSVARILVESKPHGLELTHVFNRGVARKRVDWVPASVVWSEDADAVLASDADVIVELAGGLDPAGTWVRHALEAGKSVVTANKKLIAFHGVDLERLAAAKGGHLKYGAAVAGGIPVIPGLEQGLAGDRIERIEGILNGTCNFILSKMEDGAEYATVLAEAQAKGYAEADPTEDVGGFDARAKLAILMRLALRVQIDPEEIVPRPITAVTAVDFSYARDLGCTIRQVARAEQVDGTAGRHRRSHAGGAALAAGLVARHGEHGHRSAATTAAMWSSPATARAAIRRRSRWSAICWRWRTARAASRFPRLRRSVGAEFEVPHYIRFLVSDRPGIVAAITGALANEQINIRAIVQKPGYPAQCAAVRGDRGAVQVLGAQARAGAQCAPWIACWLSRSICRCWSRQGIRESGNREQ